MNIVIYAHAFLPSVGGVEVSTDLMRKHLVALGHEVVIVTQTENRGCSCCDSIVRRPSLLKLLRIVANCDLLVVRGGIALTACLPAICVRTPYIVFHEMAGAVARKERGFFRSVKRWARTQCVKHSTLHVGVSQAVLGTLALPRASATHVLYNPVDICHLSPSIRRFEERDIDLLFVGRVTEAKGVLHLPEAVRFLSKELDRPVTVAVVGVGPAEDRLRSMTMADTNKWIFAGAESQKTLAAFYQRSRLLVVPSTTHPEGMCMVAAEALCHGTPVVHSPQAPIAETVGCGGVSADPTLDGELGRALAQVFQDGSLWEKLSREAPKSQARFGCKAYRRSLTSMLMMAVLR